MKYFYICITINVHVYKKSYQYQLEPDLYTAMVPYNHDEIILSEQLGTSYGWHHYTFIMVMALVS